MVGYKNPPLHTRFPVNRKDHTKKGPYFLPLYKKVLALKIPFDDPVTQEKIKIHAGLGLVYRKVWNGLQGDGRDIEDIMDRVDGKVNGNGKNGNSNIVAVTIKIEGADGDKIQSSQAQSVASFQR